MLGSQLSMRASTEDKEYYEALAKEFNVHPSYLYRYVITNGKEEIRRVLEACPADGDVKAWLKLYPSLNQKPAKKKEVRQSKFVEPDAREVHAYLAEIGCPNPFDEAKKFVNFYASKGWMVGKNKMKDWKRAANGWKQRNEESRQDSGEGLTSQLSDPNYALSKF